MNHEYKIKCMSCGLHFTVLSWHEDWIEKQGVDGGAYCPECGEQGGKMVWKGLPDTRQIFEIVPGSADFGVGVL